MSLVKEFKGHSGCKVELINSDGSYYVRKTGNSKLVRSAEILKELQQKGFNTPDIYKVANNEILMEYINGVDMRSYIHNANSNDIDLLVDFIDDYITKTQTTEVSDILPNVIDKLHAIEKNADLSKLNFTCLDLLVKLPKVSTVGLIHGDFTLENILFCKNKFYLIDANPTDINSPEFDVSKLRQDLDCLWFVRNEKDTINYKIVCQKISDRLKKKWAFLNNDYILIFMLMRILPYCTDKATREFLITEINKLWQ